MLASLYDRVEEIGRFTSVAGFIRPLMIPFRAT